jgi:hypothetical protein
VLKDVDGDGLHRLDRFASKESGYAPELKLSWTSMVPTTTTPSTATPTTTWPSTATPTGSRSIGNLAWAPPALSSPVTVNATTANQSLKLDDAKDYRIVLPSIPLQVDAGGLAISGGHNVVLIGGTIESKVGAVDTRHRGLFLKNQTGTIHVEGLAIIGASLTEGIDLDQRMGATVQLENIRVDEVHGSYTGEHADIIHTWAGPRELRIDGLTGRTSYQGFFLLPRQEIDGAPTYTGPLDPWDFRNINITGTAGSGYMLWKEDASIKNTNVYVNKADGATDKMLWPNASEWPGVTVGKPAADFVPAGLAGIGYTAGTGGTASPSPTTTTTSTSTSNPTPTSTTKSNAVCGSRPNAPATYKHVIWIWMENKGYSSIIGSGSAPYENTLANQCGLASKYSDLGVKPSLPNYINATSGATQGIADNNDPSSHPLTADNLFRQVRAAGGTAKSYQESMPENCYLTRSGLYAPKHNPASYYIGGDDRAACQRDNLNYTQFGTDLNSGNLPTFSFITPNLCNDTHDCSVSTGDTWLKNELGRILSSDAYATGDTAVFLMWDEGAGTEPDHMPFIGISPSVKPGTVSSSALNHHSALRTTEEMLGIKTYIGGSATATSMRPLFNL